MLDTNPVEANEDTEETAVITIIKQTRCLEMLNFKCFSTPDDTFATSVCDRDANTAGQTTSSHSSEHLQSNSQADIDGGPNLDFTVMDTDTDRETSAAMLSTRRSTSASQSTRQPNIRVKERVFYR